MNPNLIAWAIIAVAAIGMWHGIFELVVLPTIRRSNRFKLFALRDRLRDLKSEFPEQCSDEAFHLLDESISWRMDHLPILTYQLLDRASAVLKHDAALRDEVARRMHILNSCRLPEFVAIRRESVETTLQTIAFNSGGWMIYLVPIVYPWILAERMLKHARRLSVFSAHEFENLRACPA